jgi:hypothetical protein
VAPAVLGWGLGDRPGPGAIDYEAQFAGRPNPATPRPAAPFLKLRGYRLLRCPPDQPQNEQQDDCADKGVDDRGDDAGTDYNAELR